MLKKNVFAILTVLLLSSCAMPNLAPQGGGTQVKATQQATEPPMSTPTLEPSFTPWATPSPDTWITQIVADQEHDDKQLAISNNNLEIARLNENNRQTDIPLHIIGLTEVKESNDAQGTRISSISTNTSINATGTIDAQNFIKSLPTIQAAQTAVVFTAAYHTADIVVEITWPLVVFFGVICLLVYLVKKTPAPPKSLPTPTAEPAPNVEEEARTVNAASGTSSYPSVFQFRILEKYATIEQLTWLANGVLRDGKRLSHDDWTPAKTCGFSEPSFTELQTVLVRYGLAVYRDASNRRAGINITPLFVQHFSKLRNDGPSGPYNPEGEGDGGAEETLETTSPTESQLT